MIVRTQSYTATTSRKKEQFVLIFENWRDEFWRKKNHDFQNTYFETWTIFEMTTQEYAIFRG